MLGSRVDSQREDRVAPHARRHAPLLDGFELRRAEPGFGYHRISVAPPGTGFPLQPEVGLGLPAHIPAGSEVTYLLEVPIDELRLEPADEFTTGTWTAALFLEGSGGAPGSRPTYQTETSSMVPDTP